MRTVQNMLTSIEQLDLAYLAGHALFDSGNDYIRIQQEQMMLGERADGTPIFNIDTGSEYYSPGYAKYKGREAPIDLKDTGAFYAGMEVRQEAGGLLIDSDDSKSSKLTETYQPWLLNSQSKQEFSPIVQTRLVVGTVQQLNNK